MKEHYRVDELADFLDVSRRTVYEWIDCGIIKVVRVQKTIRIPRCEWERVTTALPSQIAKNMAHRR